MGIVNGLPSCGFNHAIECLKGKGRGALSWAPHAKCSKCGWNPEVDYQRKIKMGLIKEEVESNE